MRSVDDQLFLTRRYSVLEAVLTSGNNLYHQLWKALRSVLLSSCRDGEVKSGALPSVRRGPYAPSMAFDD